MSAASGWGRGRRAACRGARVVIATAVGTAAVACGRAPRRPSEVMPGHAWHTITVTGGPTHTYRAGQQVELLRGTTMMSGTYQFPTDSTLVEDVTGLLPGLGAGGPTHLTLRYDVRVLPAKDGRDRVELRAGTGVDTLARVD